jgi:signal peptidase I
MKQSASLNMVICSALLVAVLLKLFVFDFLVVEGASMEGTLRAGKAVVVLKIARRNVKVGDVLVFHTPQGSLAVKRCASLSPGVSFFALGDNVSQSYDSRDYGEVPLANIVGRVILPPSAQRTDGNRGQG